MGALPALPDGLETLTSWTARPGFVNAVGLEERARGLERIAVEGDARRGALALAVAVLELTATDRAACRSACAEAAAAGAAAVCVRPALVTDCVEWLEGTAVRVACLADGAAEARRAVEDGADEVDLAIDHDALLSGRYGTALAEIAETRAAVGSAALKVILDTGLGSYDGLRRAALLAVAAGADTVGVSAGGTAAALCVLEAICDVRDATGRVVGIKAGAVASADAAVAHLVVVHETLGPEWLTPARLRLGSTTVPADADQ